MVDLPDADRPVNHSVKPRCLRFVWRSERESDGCQVMLLGALLAKSEAGWAKFATAGYSRCHDCYGVSTGVMSVSTVKFRGYGRSVEGSMALY
jgi:hypothetical protein